MLFVRPEPAWWCLSASDERHVQQPWIPRSVKFARRHCRFQPSSERIEIEVKLTMFIGRWVDFGPLGVGLVWTPDPGKEQTRKCK